MFQTNSREVEANHNEIQQGQLRRFQTNSREVEAATATQTDPTRTGFRRTLVRLKPVGCRVRAAVGHVSDELS